MLLEDVEKVSKSLERTFPVSEAISVMLGVTTNHGDKGKCKKHEDENDLSGRKPEFCFSIPANGKQVDDCVEDNAGCAYSGEGNFIRPVCNNNVQCRNLKRNENSFVEKEVPANGKSFVISLFNLGMVWRFQNTQMLRQPIFLIVSRIHRRQACKYTSLPCSCLRDPTCRRK
jgi:hypothetical protein